MYLDATTWTPHLQCDEASCKVRPKSQYVPIRKKQIYCADIIRVKIRKMIDWWNEENPYKAIQGFEFDFEDIAEKEKNRVSNR